MQETITAAANMERLALDWGSLRADIDISHQEGAKGSRTLLRNPDTGKLIAVSAGAYRVLRSLEAGTSARQAVVRGLERDDPPPQALWTALQLIEKAHEAGLLSGGSLTQADPSASERIVGAITRWNPFYFRVPVLNPQPLMASLDRVAGALFTRAAVGLWCLAMLAVSVAVGMHWQEYGRALGVFRSFRWWLLVYGIMIIVTVLHEFGHVLACYRFGVRVRQMGLLVYLFHPTAYADVSESWMLAERWKRIAIALAGIYVEGSLWVISSVCWMLTSANTPFSEVCFVSSVCLSSRIVMNLMPLLRLDGYWVLSDLLAIPNLRPRSFAYLLSLIPLAGHLWKYPGKTSRGESAVLFVYGMSSALFLFGALAGTLRWLHGWILQTQPAAGEAIAWTLALIVLASTLPGIWRRAARRMHAGRRAEALR